MATSSESKKSKPLPKGKDPNRGSKYRLTMELSPELKRLLNKLRKKMGPDGYDSLAQWQLHISLRDIEENAPNWKKGSPELAGDFDRLLALARQERESRLAT